MILLSTKETTMDNKIIDAEVVDEAKVLPNNIIENSYMSLPDGMTENQYEGLEKDLKAYQEARKVAWINSHKNKATHQLKVFAKRKAAAKAAKKARKIQRRK